MKISYFKNYFAQNRAVDDRPKSHHQPRCLCIHRPYFHPSRFQRRDKIKCVKLLTEQGFQIVHKNQPIEPNLFPDEVQQEATYIEGAAIQVTVNRYERDRKARQAALEWHGYQCKVCGLDMARVYGEIAKGFIHVHHLIPLSEIKENYLVNPKTDLIPVCPNCHAMLHRQDPPLSPKALNRHMKAQLHKS